MDLEMPKKNGFEATKMIKEHFESNSDSTAPHIVALSASEFNSNLITKCKEAKFDGWFTSPMTTDQIQKEILDFVLEKKRL